MTEEIKARIEAIRKGEIPEGYRYTKDIGISPNDWKIGKLSDVVKNVSRPVPKPDKPYWRLGIKSWAKGTFHAFVDHPETVDMDELYEVKENDLIVNITFAWEHAIAIAKKEDEGLLVSHRFPTYVFKDEQNPEYYQAVITQQYFKDMLDHISPGGAGRNRVLNRKDFLNLPCVIPSNEEQNKIADIFLICDRIIGLKERLLEEKKRQKKWFLHQLFRNPKFQHKFSSTWETVELSEVFDYIQPTKYLVTEEDYSDEYATPVLTAGKTFILGYTNEPTGIFSDVPVVIFDDFTTDSKYVDFPFKAKSSAMKILKIKDGYNIKFAFAALQNVQYVVGGHERHWISKFAPMTVEMPPRKDQDRIAEILNTFDSSINCLEKELHYYENKKKSLQQLLLTGIVRV